MGVNMENMCRWLCHRRIVLSAETVVKPQPKERAINARDALAKQIYAHLFDWVINKINQALMVPGKQHSFIGVLDIYGYAKFIYIYICLSMNPFLISTVLTSHHR